MQAITGVTGILCLRAATGLALVLSCMSGPALAKALPIDIEAFIHAMVYKHQFDREALRKVFRQVETRPEVVQVAAAATRTRPWHEYRTAVVTQDRIDGGVKFWGIYEKVLDQVSAEYGVPQEIIVATIGIASQYGHHVGGFRAIDVLTTLAFQYRPRADFFREQLEEYMLLARQTGLDPLRIRGSGTGTNGIPQFLPSTYRKYAKDVDGNGKPDLVNSVPDALASVANYYRALGWRTGEPVAVRAEVDARKRTIVNGRDLEPRTAVADLERKGVKPALPLAATVRVALFSAQAKTEKQYWLGLYNFYLISRDDRGINHALAIHELAQELRAAKR